MNLQEFITKAIEEEIDDLWFEYVEGRRMLLESDVKEFIKQKLTELYELK